MKPVLQGVLIMLLAFAGGACSRPDADPDLAPDPTWPLAAPAVGGPQTAVFAGGCFWCVEAVFEQLDGVQEVVSGYAGDTPDTANYSAVSQGRTDHAEAVKITFDHSRISYGQLLKVFFTVAHDPTQIDRQGPDSGRQYRSAIFYQSDEERSAVESYIRQLEQAKLFSKPIVTMLEPLEAFHPAEQYHQDYVRQNPSQPYVRSQALPKVDKVRKKFAEQVRPEAAP